jgi:hypothetical protein
MLPIERQVTRVVVKRINNSLRILVGKLSPVQRLDKTIGIARWNEWDPFWEIPVSSQLDLAQRKERWQIVVDAK